MLQSKSTVSFPFVQSVSHQTHSVIVATGLIALVDDCIKRRFCSQRTKHVLIPGASRKTNLEYVGPKRLITEAFNRPGSRRSASGG